MGVTDVLNPDSPELTGPIAKPVGRVNNVDWAIPSVQQAVSSVQTPAPPQLQGGDISTLALASALGTGLGSLSNDPRAANDAANAGMKVMQLAMQQAAQKRQAAVQQYQMQLQQQQAQRAAETHALKIRAEKVKVIKDKVAGEVLPDLIKAAMSGNSKNFVAAYSKNQAKIAILGKDFVPMMVRLASMEAQQRGLQISAGHLQLAKNADARQQAIHNIRLVALKAQTMQSLAKIGLGSKPTVMSRVLTDRTDLSTIVDPAKLRSKLQQIKEYYTGLVKDGVIDKAQYGILMTQFMKTAVNTGKRLSTATMRSGGIPTPIQVEISKLLQNISDPNRDAKSLGSEINRVRQLIASSGMDNKSKERALQKIAVTVRARQANMVRERTENRRTDREIVSRLQRDIDRQYGMVENILARIRASKDPHKRLAILANATNAARGIAITNRRLLRQGKMPIYMVRKIDDKALQRAAESAQSGRFPNLVSNLTFQRVPAGPGRVQYRIPKGWVLVSGGDVSVKYDTDLKKWVLVGKGFKVPIPQLNGGK